MQMTKINNALNKFLHKINFEGNLIVFKKNKDLYEMIH